MRNTAGTSIYDTILIIYHLKAVVYKYNCDINRRISQSQYKEKLLIDHEKLPNYKISGHIHI